jgi:hypothetical protein
MAELTSGCAPESQKGERLYEPMADQATLGQKVLALLGIRVFLGYGIRQGWKKEREIYLLFCYRCRKFRTTHPQGYNDSLYCHVCS